MHDGARIHRSVAAAGLLSADDWIAQLDSQIYLEATNGIRTNALSLKQ